MSFIDEKYKMVRMKLIDAFAQCEYITLAFDFWSSRTMDSYLGIEYYYVDDSFELKSGLIDMQYFPGKSLPIEPNLHIFQNEASHTKQNIAEYLDQVLTSLKIEDKVCGFVTDSGANVVAAIKELNHRNNKSYLRVGCTAHLLHLVVSKFFPFQLKKKARSVEFEIEEEDEDYYSEEDEIPSPIANSTEEEKLFNLLVKVRKLVAVFSKSTVGTAILKETLKENGHKKIKTLKKPNLTRWSSFYMCLSRYFYSIDK